MKNQNIIKDDSNNLVCFKDLLEKKSFASALALIDENLKLLRTVYGADNLSTDVLKVVRLINESKSALSELEKSFSELSEVFGRLIVSDQQRDAQIINILFGWLDNIQRMKTDAAIEP